MTEAIQTLANAIFQSYGIPSAQFTSGMAEPTLLVNAQWDWAFLSQCSGLAKEVVQPNSTSSIYYDLLGCYWYYTIKDAVCFILGPVCLQSLGEKSLLTFASRKCLSPEEIFRLRELSKEIPVLSCEMFLKLSAMVDHFLYPDSAKMDILTDAPNRVASVELLQKEHVRYELQQRDFERSLQTERIIRTVVSTGDVAGARKMITLGSEEITVPLGPDALRSMKNNGIVTITLVARAALEGGLPVETAFPLSDIYIFKLERAALVPVIMQVLIDAIMDFTTRVRTNRYRLKGSPVIQKCCGYIIANLDRRICVAELAELAELHPDALERRFKKELGTSASNYITEAKMDQAKMLLIHTEKSFGEIACELGYGSQSYFNRVFKKIFGISPSEFRKQQTL